MFFVIPLPVIPNPGWPFHYSSYKDQPADLILTIEADAKVDNWNNLDVETFINDKQVPVHNLLDDSNEWLIKRQYIYHIEATCKEFEGAQILVKIRNIPNAIESRPLFIHRWRMYNEF